MREIFSVASDVLASPEGLHSVGFGVSPFSYTKPPTNLP
jgi:hypothetical protein